MIRRKLTLKRVDPWSVLKFGFVVNLALLLVALLGFWILWIVVGRLDLVDQFCDSVGSIVLDLQECSLNGGNIFRTLLFLGLLGVVVQTGIAVFGAFLYNLISDLTGGLAFTFLDESGDATLTTGRAADSAAASQSSRPAASTAAAAASGTAAAHSTAGGARPDGSSSRPPSQPPDQSSAPARAPADGPPWASRPSTSPSGPSGPSGVPRPGGPDRRPSPSSGRPSPTSGPTERGGPAGSGDRPPPTPPRTERPNDDTAQQRDPDGASPSRPGSGGSLWGDRRPPEDRR